MDRRSSDVLNVFIELSLKEAPGSVTPAFVSVFRSPRSWETRYSYLHCWLLQHPRAGTAETEGQSCVEKCHTKQRRMRRSSCGFSNLLSDTPLNSMMLLCTVHTIS